MSDRAWDLDYTGTTTKDADLNAGKPPDGWYRVTLEKAEDNADNGAKFLTFRVTHGPLTGVKHRERLNDPRLANTPGGAEFAKKKAACYGSRLGLVNESANGKTVQAAFSSACGREFIVRLHTRKGDEGGEFQGIDFELYTQGHPKLPADVYPLVGLVAPPNAPKGAAGGKADRSERTPAAPPAANTAAMTAMMWGTPPAGTPAPADANTPKPAA